MQQSDQVKIKSKKMLKNQIGRKILKQEAVVKKIKTAGETQKLEHGVKGFLQNHSKRRNTVSLKEKIKQAYKFEMCQFLN